MRTLALSIVSLGGLALAAAMPVAAAPVAPMPAGIHAGAAGAVQTVDYYYHHHHYHHRDWDRRHNRWHYY